MRVDQRHVIPQKNAAVISGVVSAVFLVLLVCSMFLWELTVTLVVWFAACLAACHLICFVAPISARCVKMIDYPYLLLGVLGIFLLFADNARDRDQYYAAVDEFTAPPTTSGLQVLLQEAAVHYCSNESGFRPPTFCAWNEEVMRLLQTNPDKDMLIRTIIETVAHARDRVWNDFWALLRYYLTSPRDLIRLVHGPGSSGLLPLRVIQTIGPISQTMFVYGLVNRSLAKIVTASAGGRPTDGPYTNTIQNLSLRFGRVLAWPFVLAVAVALRLTKVTADVLGWAT